MSRLIRPLKQWPHLQHQNIYSRATTLTQLLQTTTTTTAVHSAKPFTLSVTALPPSHRCVHHRARALKHSKAYPPSDSDVEEEASGSDSDLKKSRNQRKREARRAVDWGMQLAAFSTPQIKRILRLASLDEDVLEALMLVKRLGPDVKEGKRRQFNYIGKLLRDVEPELMETLIQATKVGDHGTLQAIAGAKTQIDGDANEEEPEEHEVEEEEELSNEHIATRWFDGLIKKDVEITNEVYSVQEVDFDRQELRKLVKRVHTSQESLTTVEGNEAQVDAVSISAKKSLQRFLRTIAREMP